MIPLRYLVIMVNVVKVLEHLAFSAGEKAEICGLLGGHFTDSETAVATTVNPLSNLSIRKHSFAVDVEDFCRERDTIEDAGLVLLVLYHSHLNGSTRLSFRDRKLPGITGVPLLILAWDEAKLHFECYGDVDGKMVAISVVPYHVPEAGY